MYTFPRSRHLRQGLFVNSKRIEAIKERNPNFHKTRIKQELANLGVSRLGLLKLESRYLPRIIHPDEHLKGVVYGRSQAGSVMLVATDVRVIFIDKKPLFINKDEVTYDVVSGVNFMHAGLGSTVRLHTRVRDYTVRTFNQDCAKRFVDYIETRCLEHQEMEDRRDYAIKNWTL